MYDGIFNDFETIKKHCKNNGNVAFDESAVFELLENFFPQYGAVQTVQIVIEMLDAQRIRDTKDVSDESKLEVLNNDKSSDADSIIEIEVPRKIHPYIDLTNTDSPESDDIIIEKSVTKDAVKSVIESDVISNIDENDSHQSYDYQGLSDSEISKHFDEEWHETVEDIIRSNDAPLISYLTEIVEPIKLPSNRFEEDQSNLIEIEEPIRLPSNRLVDHSSLIEIVEPVRLPSNQFVGDQSNFGIVEASEMLEENNNDPNNNLDSGIFNEESSDINNAVNPRELDIIQDSENSNSNDILIEKVTTDPIPGCSKDNETNINIKLNNRESLPHIVVHQSRSPVPGCSKDFDISNELDSSEVFDESIKSDALCIQEIIPWANLEIITKMLRKHGSSRNRKQFTLWDLMSQGSNLPANTTNKRKQENDTTATSKKIFKIDTNYDVDEPMLCSEYSNDSQSSKISACNEFNSEVLESNQKTTVDNKSSLKLMKEELNRTVDEQQDLSNKPVNNIDNHILFDEKANLMPAVIKAESKVIKNLSNPVDSRSTLNHSLNFADLSVIKERNETIVSGSLNEQSKLPIGILSSNFFPIILNNSMKERSANTCNMSNNNDEQNNDNKVKILKEDTQMQKIKEVEKAVNLFEKKNSREETEVRKIKKELEESANLFQNNDTTVESFLNTMEKKENGSPKPGKSDVIKAPKLVFQRVLPDVYAIKKPVKTTVSYIRPATFTYTNASSNVVSSTVSTRESDSKTFKDIMELTARKTIIGKSLRDQQIAALRNSLKDKFVPAVVNGKIVNTMIKPPTFNSQNPISIRQNDAMNKLTQAIRIPNNIGVEVIKDNGNRLNQPKPCTVTSQAILKPAQLSKLNVPRPEPTSTITSSTMVEHSLPVAAPVVQQQPNAINILNVPTSPSEVPDRSVYNKLRSMFPEVRKSYVKKICISPPNGANSNDKVFTLNVLIDHLLKDGHNHLRPVQNFYEEQNITALSVDEQYENLLAIFPDADPTYLRSFVENNNSEELLRQFIQQKLESHDYPTKEQYLAKIKITEQQKQYTTDFKVEKFLELFPDPFKHFENETRQCVYQPIAMEFLKSFFMRNKVSTISKLYTKNKYNISLTAKELCIIGADMRSRRYSSEMPTENIPLLQELAFVKNKKNIQNHINALKTKEEELFKELKEKNLLVTCQCCFNDECMPTKCAECNENHTFCFECITRGTETTLANGEAHVRCFTECTSEFSIAVLQKVLPPTRFSALLKKRQAAEVMAADVEGLVSCPFCHFASIPPPEDKVFKCLNPECMKETCRQCKELNHVPLRCDEVNKTDKARLMIEEKMTEALLRSCYKCKRQFYKEEGCNKMTCPCGALMCYICDKPVKNYSHFNPQGGANTHLCPLWSDDRRMNAEAVRKVAEDVKNAILKSNPNLKIDTDKLLPKLPPKTKGPHDDIPNAHQLPEHIRRIAGAAP